MPVTLPIYRCFLISPSDVQAERDAIVAAVHAWNGHVGPSLQARIEVVRWESHARPEMGAPAQAIINDQLVDGCDFGVAVFWSRLGSPTEKHPSGSAEEVERLLGRAAKVLVYFAKRDIPQSALHDDQFVKLQQLKKDYQSRGLFWTYESIENLTQQVTLHLTNLLGDLIAASKSPRSDEPVRPSSETAGRPPKGPSDYEDILSADEKVALDEIEAEVHAKFSSGEREVAFDSNVQHDVSARVWELLVERAQERGFDATLRGANITLKRPRRFRFDGDDASTMKSPSGLGAVSAGERLLVRKLIAEIEEHFRDSPDVPYVFEPFSTGAGEFGTRVKREVIVQSRRAGWIASDLDEGGSFTVRKPTPSAETERVSPGEDAGIDPLLRLLRAIPEPKNVVVHNDTAGLVKGVLVTISEATNVFEVRPKTGQIRSFPLNAMKTVYPKGAEWWVVMQFACPP